MLKILTLSLTFVSSITLAGGLAHFRSGESQVNLVELYSSEGCSSCPPADRFVSSLKGEETLWRSFVPISFHVDYWDGLGWKDAYAKPEFSQRQRDYATGWKANNVYTPELVLNGGEWANWRRAGKSRLVKNEKAAGTLEATEIKSRVSSLKFNPKENLSGELTLNGVLLGSGLASQVVAGENSGETLRHDFLVLALKKVKLLKKGLFYEGSLDLSHEEISLHPTKWSAAFWISENDGKILQATGGNLIP